MSIYRQERRRAEEALLKVVVVRAVFGGERVNLSERCDYPSWVLALRERSGWQKAVVALANKNARILWAVMTRGDAFDANHLSVKPEAS